MAFRYTEEHINYLKQIAPGRIGREITDMFNKKFGLNKTRTQIASTLSYNNIKTGMHGKGRRGCIASNRDEVGTVKIRKRSADIKIANPGEWQDFSRYLYEQYHNEKLKKDDLILFLDKNNKNFNINNLVKVTKQELRTINLNIGLSQDREINKSVIALAKLQNKIYEKQKEK